MTKIVPEDINLPIRDSRCECSDHQLIQVGCDCVAGDPIARIACWPTGQARGRPATFECRQSYAEVEARRLYGKDAKVFSVIVRRTEPEVLSEEYVRMMSRDG